VQGYSHGRQSLSLSYRTHLGCRHQRQFSLGLVLGFLFFRARLADPMIMAVIRKEFGKILFDAGHSTQVTAFEAVCHVRRFLSFPWICLPAMALHQLKAEVDDRKQNQDPCQVSHDRLLLRSFARSPISFSSLGGSRDCTISFTSRMRGDKYSPSHAGGLCRNNNLCSFML
jgi:hypothetical protein